MVLTGKQSLDYSGGVSAEDNFGIGGYDRIMGPNGQAQYWAPDLSGAVDVLLAHYAHTYRAPGERFPRPAPTTDPVDRDISRRRRTPAADFTRVGEIFDPATNPERKKPFDIRSVLRAVADADHPPLERWVDMLDAENVVVLDAHLGGQPVALLGIESRPLPRRGPDAGGRADDVHGRARCSRGRRRRRRGRSTRRAGTGRWWCWPTCRASTARRSRCASCSWSTARRSAGRWSTSTGPIVFCVVSRYHGGAFVVFSGTLNDDMEVAAVEGSYASVIGGAPAAAVVFAGEVNKRTAADPRVADLEAADREGRRGRSGGRGGPAGARSWRRSGRGCARRSWARSPTSSTRRTASSAPSAWLGAPDRPGRAPAAVPGRRGPARHGALTRRARGRWR